MRRDWPVKQAIVNLPIRWEGNSKRISGNLLNLLLAQTKDIGAASQTLLTAVKLGHFHGLAHAHLSKCCFPAGTCCIVYASNMIMS